MLIGFLHFAVLSVYQSAEATACKESLATLELPRPDDFV